MHGWTRVLRDWPRDLAALFNIAPTAMAGTYDAEGYRERSWWLIPPWSKNRKPTYSAFNAKAETLASKPTFRNAWRRAQRCIVPASAYFEWPVINGQKQCHAITRADGRPHLLAGLWEVWQPEGEPWHSFTIVTVDAAREIAHIHPRMPRALLDEAQADTWLHGSPEEAAELLMPHPVPYRAEPIQSPDRSAKKGA